jgi:hypothetical protein
LTAWGAWMDSGVQRGRVDELLDVPVERPALEQVGSCGFASSGAGLCVSPVVARRRARATLVRPGLGCAQLISGQRRLAHAIATERPYDRRRCQRFRVALRDPDETLTVVLSKAPARGDLVRSVRRDGEVEDLRHVGSSCSPCMKISRRSRSQEGGGDGRSGHQRQEGWACHRSHLAPCGVPPGGV